MNKQLIENSIDHLVVQVCRLHHARAQHLFSSLGLYRGQPEVLFLLWKKDGRSQTELSDTLHVQPATITKTISRMEKTGFVERQPSPDDQRVSLVYLTQSGRAVQNQVDQALLKMDQEISQGFSPEEKVILKRFLIQMRENLLQASEQYSKP